MAEVGLESKAHDCLQGFFFVEPADKKEIIDQK